MRQIQANEIRLGNLFALSGFSMYVEAIFKDTVYLNFEGNEGDVWEENIKDLVPIPLTEEILIKAGFLQFDSHCEDTKGVYEYYNYKYDIYDQILFVEEWRRVAKIGYLHQLQNLYFALTGEEIKIEL